MTTRLAKAKGYLADTPEEQGAAVYALNLSLVGALGLALQNLITPHRAGAHYIGNGIELDSGFHVSHVRIKGNEDCWLGQIRVPIDHPLARPNERCPHCHPRLWGSLGTHSILHPACSEQASELVLPDANRYTHQTMAPSPLPGDRSMRVKPARRYLAAPPTTWSGWALHFLGWAGHGLWSLTMTAVQSSFWPWLWGVMREAIRSIGDRR